MWLQSPEEVTQVEDLILSPIVPGQAAMLSQSQTNLPPASWGRQMPALERENQMGSDWVKFCLPGRSLPLGICALVWVIRGYIRHVSVGIVMRFWDLDKAKDIVRCPETTK